MIDQVTRVLVEAAEIAIRPRFRRLTTDQIKEKAPKDLVTVADLEAERLISRGLLRILDIPVVGEEATAADPALLSALGERECWLVDPIDGTSNFVSGRQEYAVMVALLRKGAPVAGWILLPESGQVYAGEQGSGAFRDGARIRQLTPPAAVEQMRGAAPTKRLNRQQRAELSKAGALFASLGPGASSAGVNYTQMLDGHLDFVLYQRSMPWDHAGGALLLAEVSGVSVRPDGAPYRIAKRQTGLLLNAANRACCQAVQTTLWA
ncbi:inositol monophosphatase family protein [Nocardia rhamnosiphila]